MTTRAVIPSAAQPYFRLNRLKPQGVRHVEQEGWAVSRDELLRRFAALPDTFPHTKRYAAELTSGTALDRFEFTLHVIIDGLGNHN